jgi:hypothetical protein
MRSLRGVLIFFLLLMANIYTCVPPCRASYPKQAALSIHQAKCPHASASDPSLDAALEKRRAKKRRRLEAEAPVASTSSAPDESEYCFKSTLDGRWSCIR